MIVQTFDTAKKSWQEPANDGRIIFKTDNGRTFKIIETDGAFTLQSMDGDVAVASFAFEAFGGPDEATVEAFKYIQGDNERGLYGKFKVERTDGKSAPGEKHDGCDYFILDMDHDDHARAAIQAYVTSLENSGEYPELSRDLRYKYL